MKLEDTIIAPATPPGASAIAVFRISGKNLTGLIGKILPLDETEHGRIKKTLLRDEKGSLIDEITFIKYNAPRSYTGEDMVELFSHGGYANVKRILHFFTQLGLRLADPGEFTFRALLNGKISLTKAESVDRICRAENIVELNSALMGLSGRSNEEFEHLYERFIKLYGDIVSEIEFIEGDVEIGRFKEDLKILIGDTERLIDSFEKVSLFVEGFDIVIAGKTNTGKSSLFNRLIGEERSIVTEIEGTTRDLIDKKVFFGNVPIRFVDTAGLRETADKVELIGQRRTREEIKRAKLIIYLTDVKRGLDAVDQRVIDEHKERILLAVNKIDLNPSFSLNGIEGVYYISAKYGQGIDELKEGIREFVESQIDFGATSCVFTRRQYELLVNIRGALKRAISVIENNQVLDILVYELNDVRQHFEDLLGKNIDEDLYTSIFSRFCVGK